jgi:serine/threonine-protein kinase HipA
MAVLERSAILGIFLAPTPTRELRVGSLLRDAGGGVTFVTDEAYLAIGPKRPMMSVAWLGATEEETIIRLSNPRDKIMRGGRLPPFFENLLPEGALRELVDREFGTGAFDNFDVLARLGEDLPGAVVARLEAIGHTENPVDRQTRDALFDRRKIRFSLAGVQLKFSVSSNQDHLTIPAQDELGDIILKTPSSKFALLPEAEFTAMHLARAAGIRTPDVWLVDASAIEGIPEEFLVPGANSLAIRRFDRIGKGGRVQVEDFSQIVGAMGDQKYTMANHETIMNIIGRFSSDRRGELLEGVRRFVCNIMIGNGDAHLKNWSFIYPDDGAISLTPAYDIVPTFLYGDNRMALAFAGSKNYEAITLHRFDRLANLLKVDPKFILKEVRQTIQRILDVWPRVLADMPLPADMKTSVTKRWDDLPLVREISSKTT